MQEQPGYADSGKIMAVEFDRKIIVYWWMTANIGLLSTIIGIPLMLIWPVSYTHLTLPTKA